MYTHPVSITHFPIHCGSHHHHHHQSPIFLIPPFSQLAYNYGSFICAGLFAGICFLAAAIALYFHVQVRFLANCYFFWGGGGSVR